MRSNRVEYWEKMVAAILGDDQNVGFNDPSLLKAFDWPKLLREKQLHLGHDFTYTDWLKREDAYFLSHRSERWMGLWCPCLKTKRYLGHMKIVKKGSREQQFESLLGVYNAGIFNPISYQIFDVLSKYGQIPTVRELRAKRLYLEGFE
jgi:hypothetical protein